MPSIAVYFLPVALFAILQAVAPTEEDSQLEIHPARQDTLRLLPMKRSLEAASMAPPSIYSESLIDAPTTRDNEELWIWMPAYGYRQASPGDPEAPEVRDLMGNIIRYGSTRRPV